MPSAISLVAQYSRVCRLPVVLCPPWRSCSYFRYILALGGRGGLAYPPDWLFLFCFCGGCYHGASLASIPSMWVECDVGSAARRGGKKRSCLFVLFRPEQKYSLVSYLAIFITYSFLGMGRGLESILDTAFTISPPAKSSTRDYQFLVRYIVIRKLGVMLLYS